MSLLKFKVGNGLNGKSRVVVDPRSLMLLPLLDIWNFDQTPTKDIANDYLCYVHIVSQLDPAAPFYNASFDEVRFLAKSQIYRNMEHQFSEEEEVMIQNAIDVYIKDNEVSEERMLQVFSKKIDQMRLELEAKNLEITRNEDPMTKKVTYATNAKMITDVMKEIGNILKIKEDLAIQIENSRAKGDSKIRANRDPSFLEKQLMKSQSDARARNQPDTPTEAGGPEQPDLQEDGPQPAPAEAQNQRAISAHKPSSARKPSKEEEAAAFDEQFF